MRYTSNRSRTENIQTRCCSCGVNVVRNADRQGEVVLSDLPGGNSRIKRSRREDEEAPAREGLSILRLHAGALRQDGYVY